MKFHKANLIIVSVGLLLVFTVAIWLIGRQINITTDRMYRTLVVESGRYRAGLIQQDFDRTEKLGKKIDETLESQGYHREKLSSLLDILVSLDKKITRGWVKKEAEQVIYNDWLQKDTIRVSKGADEIWESGLYGNENQFYRILYGRWQDIEFGFDISLTDLHSYFTQLIPARKNYAYIANASGVLIAHPDKDLIGQSLENSRELHYLAQVAQEKKEFHYPGFSNFLVLAVEKSYYPIQVGQETWVMVINTIPLDNRQAMAEFHRYTVWIAIVAILIFCALLIFSQYKWQKEYELRRKAEWESMQLKIQQLKNQLNPHFLFNALGSLSALITTDPALAKKFVFELAKVYRYVLEKRNETLSTVKEELEFTCHYYFLQKIRFGEQLRLHISEGVEEHPGKIPVASLQLLIENAIKHNEITHRYPLDISIYIAQEMLIVDNSYRPRRDVSLDSIGVGLESIQEIYRYHSAEKFEYRVVGDRFICILPFLKD